MEKTYSVLVERMSEMKKKIEVLNRRALKLGVAPIEATYGEVSKRSFINEGGVKVFKQVQAVTIKGETPKLNGWTLGAVLTAMEADGETLTMVATVPGVTIDTKYRSANATVCEHCGKARRRSETFVCIHEDGSSKQVGRSCLKDFLGGQDPHVVAAVCEYMAELDQAAESMSTGGNGSYDVDLETYMPYVTAAVRAAGWLSRSAARDMSGAQATADIAYQVMMIKLGLMRPPPQGIDPDFYPTEDDMAKAAGAAAYVAAYLADKSDMSDYEYNLSVAMRFGLVTSKTYGLLASIIPVAIRQQGQELQRRQFANIAKDSKHFGTVKGKVEIKATILDVRYLEGQYGTTTMIKMATTDGNVAVWFASGSKDVKVGAEIALKGTIKAHTEFNGTKQTVMTRCTLT